MCGTMRDVLLMRPDGMASVKASQVVSIKTIVNPANEGQAYKIVALLKDKTTFIWAVEAQLIQAQARVKDFTYAVNGWAREADHA